MYLLSTLAAGFVRGIYIDRLDKLSEGIGRQFREGTVPLYPLNKLPYILCLLFMFMDLLLQTFDLGFEVFLFLGVVFAHHGESFIIQPTGNIVLVNADEKTVKLSDSLLSLCQPLLMQPQRFLALHTELLLHLRTEIRFIASDYRYDLLNVLPDDLFHDASELPVEGFRSLVAAGYCVFRAAVFFHYFDIGQPKGGRIFHHDVALFIERKLSLGGIVGAWLDLGIRVRIGEIK